MAGSDEGANLPAQAFEGLGRLLAQIQHRLEAVQTVLEAEAQEQRPT
jgi:hypothetical protein